MRRRYSRKSRVPRKVFTRSVRSGKIGETFANKYVPLKKIAFVTKKQTVKTVTNPSIRTGPDVNTQFNPGVDGKVFVGLSYNVAQPLETNPSNYSFTRNDVPDGWNRVAQKYQRYYARRFTMTIIPSVNLYEATMTQFTVGLVLTRSPFTITGQSTIPFDTVTRTGNCVYKRLIHDRPSPRITMTVDIGKCIQAQSMEDRYALMAPVVEGGSFGYASTNPVDNRLYITPFIVPHGQAINIDGDQLYAGSVAIDYSMRWELVCDRPVSDLTQVGGLPSWPAPLPLTYQPMPLVPPNSQQSRLAAAEQQNADQELALAKLNQDVASNDGDIAALDSQLFGLGATLSSVDTQLQQQITQNSSALSPLASGITQVQTNLDTHALLAANDAHG